MPTHRTNPMNTPPPDPSNPPEPSPGSHVDEAQIRAWLKLKGEVAELHARLEYLKLMLQLGVRQSRSRS
jgi:acyl-CoA-binding protein